MDIFKRIQSQYESLSRTQKNIADYLLSNPDEACFLSLKAFAEKVKATEVTVINFSHRIGLNGFSELKSALCSHVRGLLSPNDKLRYAFQKAEGTAVQHGECIANEMQILRETFRNLNPDDLFSAVSMLETASRVYIIGYDSSMPVAQFMLLRLRYLGLDAEPLDFGDYSHMMLEVSRCDSRALFIIISFPLHFFLMNALAAVIKAKQRRLIAIVSDSTCEITQQADLTLHCQTSDVVFFNSITSAISLVNLICTLYASRHQDDLLSIRKAVQASARELADQLPPNPSSTMIVP